MLKYIYRHFMFLMFFAVDRIHWLELSKVIDNFSQLRTILNVELKISLTFSNRRVTLLMCDWNNHVFYLTIDIYIAKQWLFNNFKQLELH
jgi:hypothetical protein